MTEECKVKPYNVYLLDTFGGGRTLRSELSVRKYLKLKYDLQCQLNDPRTARGDISLGRPRIGQRLRDLAVIAVRQVRGRIIEHRVIEDVEEFRSELHADAVALQWNLLERAHVPTEHAGSAQGPLAQSPECAGRVLPEGRPIEPLEDGIEAGGPGRILPGGNRPIAAE